jgi:hypothetical protein
LSFSWSFHFPFTPAILAIPSQQNITRFNLREKKERIAQIAGLTLAFSLARKAPGHLVMT